MSTRTSHPMYGLPSTEVEGFDALAELALDLRWSWNHVTDEVWRQLDPVLWAITRNPGLSCRRFRETTLSVCWPIPCIARLWIAWCRAGGKRQRRLRGFSIPIRNLR